MHLDIPTGKSVDNTVSLPAGDRVEAFLEGEDLLTADDRAVAVGTQARPLRVLVAGPEDAFLDNVLSTLPGVRIERSETARPAPGYDVAIYNGVAVPTSPGAPFLAIAAPGGSPGVTVRAQVDQPSLTVVANDPLLADLDLSEVAIASTQDLVAPEADALVRAEGTPLLVRGRKTGNSTPERRFSSGRYTQGSHRTGTCLM